MPLVNLNKKTGGLYIRPKTHELGFVPYKGYNKEARTAGHGRQKIIDKLFIFFYLNESLGFYLS